LIEFNQGALVTDYDFAKIPPKKGEYERCDSSRIFLF
jgi:hypothetical protein